MSRFTLGFGGIIRQAQKRNVVWSTDVTDNSKPLPDVPKICMTDDEAKKKAEEMATIRESKKQAQAQARENFDVASSSKATNFGQNAANGSQSSFNLERVSSLSENEKKFQRALRFADNGNSVDQSSTSDLDQKPTFNIEQAGKISWQTKTAKFEDDNSIGQELGSLSDFAVEQAAQISKLSEGERKRQRSLRFGAQPLQNLQSQKPKPETKRSQELELEQLGTRVKDFFDTTKLYAQVQYAISETTNEMISNEPGRTRAWDYFDDGFRAEPRAETRVESLAVYQENSRGVLEDAEKVDESGLNPESDSTLESGDMPAINVNAKMVQVVDDLSFVPVTSVSEPSGNSSEVTSVHEEEEEEDTTADRDKNDDNDENAAIDNDIFEKSVEEEIIPSFRFSTVCDLRDEVYGSPPPVPFQSRREEFRREVTLKRKATFKLSAIKVANDREPATEHLRRRKDRLALFDAKRANSIAAVLSQLDSEVNLDTPAERLFRLEHPEYFPKESVESRDERLREYERARSAYDVHIAKLMAKQEKRQAKVIQKRLRELEDEELLREARKVARQKIQEEIGWTPPSDADIWKWREERGKLPPAEDEKYDEKESDEENDEYYDAFEESPESSKTLRSSLRRNEKVLSYSELRRRVRERERNKKVQSELSKMQETARKCQIEDLRNQVLEEERTRKRHKLVDLSNERDRRDSKTIQHIREVAASKIAIGRAIRELEDKIAEAEAQLSRKRRFEDLVNDQLFYMKCIRREELKNGTEADPKQII